MLTQIFRITRAPEAEPITAQKLKHLLWRARTDSEWDVQEVELRQAVLLDKANTTTPTPPKSKEEIVVANVLETQLALPVRDYHKNKAKTWNALGADSLDLVELLMDLECRIGFDIPDQEAEKFSTPAQVAEYLRENKCM